MKLYGGHFDPDKRKNKIAELEKAMQEADFWNDKRNSEKVISELNYNKNLIENVTKIMNQIKGNLKLIDESLEYSDTSDIKNLIEIEKDEIKEKIDELSIEILLNGPFDNLGCLLEIHPGAGGTESCDWALMLYRMYTRFCEKKNYKYEVVDYQEGDEAGIKSATLLINTNRSYGYLKSEKGVHRLVRISPFDSNSRRHTSFASVDITPLFLEDDIDIDINPNDIRIDVYRSSGHGGQGVNTTDSAVRITHIPTKTVVTCQNERSQIQNKEKALEILKTKLYKLEIEKRENKMKDIKGELSAINFGSQIRSYVMHPYYMVKDHRTNAETSNVSKVLDGDIDLFINSYLRSE